MKRWKRTFFSVLLILLGLLLLAGTEYALRVFGVGKDYRLLTREIRHGQPYFRINRGFPEKYFRRISDAPEFRDELIPVIKERNSRRIVVLGGSSAFGFPYTYTITFPDMLEWMLNRNDPDIRWDVINLSASAINSFSAADIAGRIAPLQPDALVIYMGHNEFYGAYGSASTERGSRSYFLTRGAIRLTESHLYQMLRSVSFTRRSDGTDSGGALMSRVVRNRTIPYASPLYLKTRHFFLRNLYSIKDAADELDIPVFISTLVSNEKDMIPFASDFNDADMRNRSVFDEFFSYISADDTTGASLWLSDLKVWEPESAIYAYCKAEYLHWIGSMDSAAIWYSKARDLDVLRFRAASDWNHAIRLFAVQNGWHLAEADSVFHAVSRPDPPGLNLLHEHVHPNPEGYRLIADAFFRTLISSGFAPKTPQTGDVSGRLFLRDFPMTPFELRAGELSIEKLMNGWPFRDEPRQFDFNPLNPTDHYVWEYLNHRTGWGEANRELLEYHRSRNETETALRYADNLILVLPEAPYPHLAKAQILAQAGKTAAALKALQNVDKQLNSADIWLFEGMLQYNAGEKNLAVFAFNEARRAQELNPVLNQSRKNDLYYYLASVYAEQGEFVRALRILDEASERFELNPRARTLRRQIEIAGSK